MTTTRPRHVEPAHGQLAYLQLPAADPDAAAAFYAEVFGWQTEPGSTGFTAPGLIGQWTADRAVEGAAGPLLWLWVDDLGRTLHQVVESGGRVRDRPQPDGDERWLVEIDDPAGNRLGLVAAARRAAAQPLLAVRDVEASSRWYQRLLGLAGDHGGSEYERLTADGALVLQLHHDGTGHHHGPIGDTGQPRGDGVLVWFGEVVDFDGVVARAAELGARVVRAPHRNPPEGGGNGPGHREVWIEDPDGYVVVAASPDGEAFEPA